MKIMAQFKPVRPAKISVPAAHAFPKPPAPQKAPHVAGISGPEFGKAVGVSGIMKPRAVFKPVKEQSKQAHWSGV